MADTTVRNKPWSGGTCGGKNPNASGAVQHATVPAAGTHPPHRAGQIPPTKPAGTNAGDYVRSGK